MKKTGFNWPEKACQVITRTRDSKATAKKRKNDLKMAKRDYNLKNDHIETKKRNSK